MRVAIVNAAADRRLATPDALLARYHTLTGWGDALAVSGAREVLVVQRFHAHADVQRRRVTYAFRGGRVGPLVSRRRWLDALLDELRRFRPALVHVNGTAMRAELLAIRRDLPGVPVVVQHHGEAFHRDPLRRRWTRRALAAADALLFTCQTQAAGWKTAGVIDDDTPVFGVIESSTTLAPLPRESARLSTGVMGSPAILCVGRLNDTKDPLTVLKAFARVRDELPHAQLYFLHQTSEHLQPLREMAATDPRLASVVHFVGMVPHAQMAAWYSAADLFVLGSRHEGSGYAVIEAIACGLPPVVTDIPSFRALTGAGVVGALWPVGDDRACAEAIVRTSASLSPEVQRRTRSHFERTLSWPVVGASAIEAYRQVIERTSPRRGRPAARVLASGRT